MFSLRPKDMQLRMKVPIRRKMDSPKMRPDEKLALKLFLNPDDPMIKCIYKFWIHKRLVA